MQMPDVDRCSLGLPYVSLLTHAHDTHTHTLHTFNVSVIKIYVNPDFLLIFHVWSLLFEPTVLMKVTCSAAKHLAP